MTWPAAVFLLLAPAWAAERLEVRAEINAPVIPAFEIMELTFRHSGVYPRPFLDVSIDVELTSPSGIRRSVGGFLYGSLDPPRAIVDPAGKGRHEGRKVRYEFERLDAWKARFAPGEPGRWRYRWEFRDAAGRTAKGRGKFSCVAGRRPGFLRISRDNPFQLEFPGGVPFFPVGTQECWGDGSANGSVLDRMSMEGPFRTDRPREWGKLPAGPAFQSGPGMNPQNGDVYFRTFARCGFNLFRFSHSNCSYPLFRNLDDYLIQEAVMTDEMLAHVRRYGFRIMYGLFGFAKAGSEAPDDKQTLEKAKRFVKYSVDRWGAYVDIWEFLNEQKADAGWYEELAPYLRSLDPYAHPITTSWERPELPEIEINAPHWYQWLDGRDRRRDHEILLNTDRETAERAMEWKKHGKPVIVGEAGNYTDPKRRSAGQLRGEVGGVWDPESALRMRVRNWTGLFSQIYYVFWATSYAKDGHFMNQWIGPKERQYVSAMQDSARRLGPGIEAGEASVSDPERVRAYALVSREASAAYLYHFSSHAEPVEGLRVGIEVPRAGTAYWYSPEDGSILAREPVNAGAATLSAPPFKVDLALLVSAGPAPDADGDGRPNDLDDDDDGDGTPDKRDAFPLEPSEWADADGDDIGDNLDADDDGDGKPDDANKNGIPDFEEQDFDGDGVPRSGAIPWDAFPYDPTEWRDTDGDGTGDNADLDDDNDGFPDSVEQRAKTSPLDPLDFPR